MATNSQTNPFSVDVSSTPWGNASGFDTGNVFPTWADFVKGQNWAGAKSLRENPPAPPDITGGFSPIRVSRYGPAADTAVTDYLGRISADVGWNNQQFGKYMGSLGDYTGKMDTHATNVHNTLSGIYNGDFERKANDLVSGWETNRTNNRLGTLGAMRGIRENQLARGTGLAESLYTKLTGDTMANEKDWLGDASKMKAELMTGAAMNQLRRDQSGAIASNRIYGMGAAQRVAGLGSSMGAAQAAATELGLRTADQRAAEEMAARQQFADSTQKIKAWRAGEIKFADLSRAEQIAALNREDTGMARDESMLGYRDAAEVANTGLQSRLGNQQWAMDAAGRYANVMPGLYGQILSAQATPFALRNQIRGADMNSLLGYAQLLGQTQITGIQKPGTNPYFPAADGGWDVPAEYKQAQPQGSNPNNGGGGGGGGGARGDNYLPWGTVNNPWSQTYDWFGNNGYSYNDAANFVSNVAGAANNGGDPNWGWQRDFSVQ